MLLLIVNGSSQSPKCSIPAEAEYRAPSPTAARDLGPPPPGYGRYADFDRQGGGGGGSGGGGGGPQGGHRPFTDKFDGAPKRNLDEVLCFKVILFAPAIFRLCFTDRAFLS